MSGKFGEPFYIGDSFATRDLVFGHDGLMDTGRKKRLVACGNALACFRPEKLAALVEACESTIECLSFQDVECVALKQALAAFRDDDEQ